MFENYLWRFAAGSVRRVASAPKFIDSTARYERRPKKVALFSAGRNFCGASPTGNGGHMTKQAVKVAALYLRVSTSGQRNPQEVRKK